MANTNVDFDFESIFSDIPDGNSDDGLDFSDIFGGDSTASEEKKEESVAAAPAPEEAPAVQAPAEEVKAEAPAAPAEEAAVEDVISEVEAMAEEELKAQEEKEAEPVTESQPEVKQGDAVEDAVEETAASEAEAAKEEAVEAQAHAEAAELKLELKTEEVPTKAEEVAKVAANEEEPQVEVEVTKPKKRRTRKAAAKPAVDGEIITEHSSEIDSNFIGSLLLVPGKEFLEEKNKIEKLMSEITLESGMSDAVIDTMIAKNMLLLQHIAGIEYGYHVAYENLTNKDTGLIKRVQDNAMLTCEGTAKDKQLAASVAVANYEYVKGHKVDLYQHANALRGAAYFVKRAAEFQKATSIALSTFRKNAA